MSKNREKARHIEEDHIVDVSHHDRLSISFKLLNLLAFMIFMVAAGLLVVYGWMPSRGSLTQEKGTVTSVTKQSNSRYEALIVTEKGAILSCTGGLAWHSWADTCPIKQLQNFEGDRVTVVHDGKRPYEIISEDGPVLAYRAFHESQLTMLFLALFSVACAFVAVLKRGK